MHALINPYRECAHCWLSSQDFGSLQGRKVRLGTSHAALLEGTACSWESGLQEGAHWKLVDLLRPDPGIECQEDVDQPPLDQAPWPQAS